MGCWYTDLADAEEQVATLQAKFKAEDREPQSLSIEATPLSHAFALSERWVNEGANVPLRMQASKTVIASLPGFPELPEELRGGFNPKTSVFPLWQLDELNTDEVTPFFFHAEDLAQYWAAETGRPPSELPREGLDVTDLRVLIARMATLDDHWDRVLLVPPRRSMEVTTQAIEDGAEPTGRRLGHKADPLDEPPPLEGDEPPPLEKLALE